MNERSGLETPLRLGKVRRVAGAATALLAIACLCTAPDTARAEDAGAKASPAPSAAAKTTSATTDAEEPELVLPEGFGPARFYDSREKVQAAFPDAKLLRDSTDNDKMSSNTIMPPIAAIEVTGQEVAGLTGCRVVFGFVADQLYAAEFDCGSDPAVRQRIEETYGEPSLEIDDAVYWMTSATTLSMNPRSMRFAFRSRPLELALQDAVRRAIAAGEATINK